MRRKAGISSLLPNPTLQSSYKAVASEIQLSQIQAYQAQTETFKTQLQKFAQKHAKEIKRSPEFRRQFQKMCAEMGVDPLQSNKGFWASTLGIGDFYYELAIQIIEISILHRQKNGGLIDIDQILKHLRSKRERRKAETQNISTDDIVQAIRTLKPLGNSFTLIKAGSTTLLQSIPRELDMDSTTALSLAQKNGGMLTLSHLKKNNWQDSRIQACLDALTQNGICWLDEQGEETAYYIPAFYDL